MSEVIIVALIAAIGSVLGQWIISRGQTKQRKSDDDVRNALIDKRLNSMEEKIDIHNGYAEKFSEIQTDIAVIKNDIQNLYHRMGG